MSVEVVAAFVLGSAWGAFAAFQGVKEFRRKGEVCRVNEIQSCTVDVAEHQELKELLESRTTFNEQLVKKLNERDAEVARFKKELAEANLKVYDATTAIQKASAEGERRAMERVKKLLEDVLKDSDNWETIKIELGLGEEEKR